MSGRVQRKDDLRRWKGYYVLAASWTLVAFLRDCENVCQEDDENKFPRGIVLLVKERQRIYSVVMWRCNSKDISGIAAESKDCI